MKNEVNEQHAIASLSVDTGGPGLWEESEDLEPSCGNLRGACFWLWALT